MDSLQIGTSDLKSSRLVHGCMRIVGDNSDESRRKGKAAVRTAYESGFTHFDHADIYGGGKCEELFAEVLREIPGMREKIIITSKCGIIGRGNPVPDYPARYDFSEGYILKSVDGILKRLNTGYIDILLLHRPDFLFRAEEVAGAFEQLKNSGKVRHFGVSNFHPSQLSLLQSYCPMPLIINQVEINIHNINALLDGTLDQCQEQNISPQAWCPLGGVVYPAWGNIFSPDDEQRIKAEFDRQAAKFNTENWIVMLAWLLKHPARIFPIVGTTNSSRISASLQALEIDYRREDWYRLLEARNGQPVP
ncbi:aldo/keto reductase [bacterium]|nr:aldo/keto reductase [bacterium]MBU1064129.1 aldo/keto reductase [bacterium]MBU1634891.1 aldo/keto reductase [bacterium]MBU1872666.1 aldo/keto reductase [bacterium]